MILIFNTLLISLDVDILFILLNIIFVIPILFIFYSSTSAIIIYYMPNIGEASYLF